MKPIAFDLREYTLPPNSRNPVYFKGTSIRCLSASAEFAIAIDGGTAAGFFAGLTYSTPRDETYEEVALINRSGVPVTVRLALAYGDIEDDRLTLTAAVQIAPAVAFTDAPAVAVTDVAVQLLPANPNRTNCIIRAGAADLWLGPDALVGNAGVATVPAGGALTISHTAAVYARRSPTVTADAGVYEETA